MLKQLFTRMNGRSLRGAAIALALCMGISAGAQRIAVLSDIHVTPGNENETQLRAAVAEINASPFDAVVIDGDLTNEGSDEQLINVKAILDSISHPLLVLPGNHENTWSQSATKTFTDLWGADRFVYRMDSLLLIGINCGPFMKMGDGHIKQEDLFWLDSTLARECAVPGTKVLSFNHYPLLDDMDNYPQYTAILERYPVLAHVNGHYHRWRTYVPGRPESSQAGLPGVMVRALDMRNGTYGYTIIELDPQCIHIYNKNVGSEPEPKFAFAASTTHPAMPVPVLSATEVPEGFTLDKVWADSASVFTRIGFDDRCIYFGNSLGQVRAVNKADGSQAWSAETGAPLFSRPVNLGSGRIAVPAHDGIHIYNARTGKQIKFQPSSEGPYVADGLLTDDGRRYLQGGYKRFECRRPSDGRLMWSFDSINNYCQAAPAVDGNDVVFGAWDTKLRCLDLNTGRMRWSWDNGRSANMLGPGNVVPVITEDKVFVVAPDRYMTAIDRATGTQLWRDNSHKYRESLGGSQDGSRVYAKTMDGELVAVDATSGDFRELFTVDLGIGYEHAPCIVAELDGLVYAGSRRGVLSVVDPENQVLVASIPLGVSEINGIDIDPSDGSVYVSLIEGTVWRLKRN